MAKVRCKYCTKCVDGKCYSKKNTSVNLTKKRFCNKYIANTEEIQKDLDKVKNNNIPLFRNTFRYYEKEWAKASKMQNRKIGDGTQTADDLTGPDLVRVR